MSWVNAPSTRSILYSQIGIRLLDEFTGAPPQYAVSAELEYRDSNGDWQATGREATVTPSGVLSYPGLGRRSDALVSAVVLRLAWLIAELTISAVLWITIRRRREKS